MKQLLTAIGKQFRLPGEIIHFSTIKNGNINATYEVRYRSSDGMIKAYVFQKINTYVFRNPDHIMENIDRVTTHIRNKHPGSVNLHYYHTNEGKNYYYDIDGSFWRVMNYVDSITFNTCENLSVVDAVGRAFGEFQMNLSDFDGSLLHETIPDFHNTKKRLDTLFEHVTEDSYHRADSVKAEIEYIDSVRDQASELSVRYANGEFPVRVTHNDTKSNNVLFDRVTFEPLVVIDLDTVMPGMAMYDFADAVRFIGNTAAEDEPDLTRVSFDVEKFRAFSHGFVGKVRDAFTDEELCALPLAVFSITIELAARFLDDYLTGDKYFKLLYPEHNVVRTRCQLHLAKDIMRKMDALEAVIRECR